MPMTMMDLRTAFDDAMAENAAIIAIMGDSIKAKESKIARLQHQADKWKEDEKYLVGELGDCRDAVKLMKREIANLEWKVEQLNKADRSLNFRLERN